MSSWFIHKKISMVSPFMLVIWRFYKRLILKQLPQPATRCDTSYKSITLSPPRTYFGYCKSMNLVLPRGNLLKVHWVYFLFFSAISIMFNNIAGCGATARVQDSWIQDSCSSICLTNTSTCFYAFHKFPLKTFCEKFEPMQNSIDFTTKTF